MRKVFRLLAAAAAVAPAASLGRIAQEGANVIGNSAEFRAIIENGVRRL